MFVQAVCRLMISICHRWIIHCSDIIPINLISNCCRSFTYFRSSIPKIFKCCQASTHRIRAFTFLFLKKHKVLFVWKFTQPFPLHQSPKDTRQTIILFDFILSPLPPKKKPNWLWAGQRKNIKIDFLISFSLLNNLRTQVLKISF